MVLALLATTAAASLLGACGQTGGLFSRNSAPIWPRTPRTIQNLMKAICRPFRVTRHKRRMTTEELATERRHNGGTGVDQQARGCERDPVWHTFLRAVQAQEPTLGIERGRHG